MLCSLDGCVAHAGQQVEIILVDSASTDGTLEELGAWARQRNDTTVLHLSRPGKARALNVALRATSGALLVFTDDDVTLAPDWIAKIRQFFDDHPDHMAATGRILMHPDTPVELAQRAVRLGTLPLYDRGGAVQEVHHLYGCNMAIRRAALDQIGLFNEALGPGASGLHEDGDMARRILAQGLRIGYMPQAVVYHVVEEERLTFEFFREMQRRDARSRFVLKPDRSLWRVGLDCAGAALTAAWWALLANPRQRLRARGRLISHLEMWRLVRSAAR